MGALYFEIYKSLEKMINFEATEKQHLQGLSLILSIFM